MQQTIAKDISSFNAAHNDLPVAKDEDNIHSGHMHMPRIVTIWHFGRFSLTEYKRERFETSWGDGLNAFRINSKQFRNKKDENKEQGKQYS